MTPDVTAYLDRSHYSHIEYVNSVWSAFEKLIADSSPKSAQVCMRQSETESEKVIGKGQIASMSLPRGWVEGKTVSGGVGTRSWQEFHPPASPDANLCFYFRGLPASQEGGAAFRAVLDKPAHVLSQSEINSLGEVLRGKNDPTDFTAVMIRTEDLNGKKVLMVSGRLNRTQEDLHEILLDTRGDGKTVQEIYFQAPKDLYMKYIKDVKDSFKSIEWK